MNTISITRGFSEDERAHVARLYWQAFSVKLSLTMHPKAKALAFFGDALNPDFAFVARNSAGHLLGVAGFKTSSGALIQGGIRKMAATYGWFGALWRTLTLSLLQRDTVTDTLLMDGIFVDADARGQGIGTMLLSAIKQQAADDGVSYVRLDVIDTNPRARALYARNGFVATETQRLGPLRHIFKFRSATKMIYTVQH